MNAVIRHRILSVSDRDRLKRRLDEVQRSLKGELVVPTRPGEGLSERRMGRYAQFMDKSVREDPGILIKEQKRLERVLRNGSPDSLSKAKRIALERKVAEQREWLRKRMTPRQLYYAGYNSPDFERAKKSIAANDNSPEFQRVADDYKNSMRQLDPDNSDASNIERLRPE